MYCRTSLLHHVESGVAVQTPLLVPSFSSKGFTRPRTRKSDVSTIFSAVSEFITEIYLISAYDLYYEHLPKPHDLSPKPELIFVDSGGYEISPGSGYSAVFESPVQPHAWTTEKLQSVLNNWPRESPAVFVNFDHPDDRKTFRQQVADAKDFFRSYDHHLKLFLLKPETRTQSTLSTVLQTAIEGVAELRAFDIVGVTEKELGRTMIDRMYQLARLRRAMNRENIDAPLHVFGALDPLSVCLYFISGAEIFDGLSWLRYGYHDGLCVYTHNLGAAKYGLDFSDDLVRMRAITENYYALLALRRQLVDFKETKDFGKLEPHGNLIERAWDSLRTEVTRRS